MGTLPKTCSLGYAFPWNMMEGAKGVQLAELGIKSWEKKAWINIPKL